MKNLFNFLILGLFLFSLGSCASLSYPPPTYGENYSKDKFDRNGFTGTSELVFLNRTRQDITITVSDLDPISKEIISSQDYFIPAATGGGFIYDWVFRRNGKVKIPLSGGWVRVDDNVFDHAVFEVVPGTKYKSSVWGDPPAIPAESLDSWFKTGPGVSPDRP